MASLRSNSGEFGAVCDLSVLTTRSTSSIPALLRFANFCDLLSCQAHLAFHSSKACQYRCLLETITCMDYVLCMYLYIPVCIVEAAWLSVEAAWVSGQSWGFECGRSGFKSPTRTTEWIYPRWSQGQLHHALQIASWCASYQLGFLTRRVGDF